MKASATLKFGRMGARKVRYVADLVRGKRVDSALSQLRFSKREAARTLEKLLRSAVSNAEQSGDADIDNLYISELQVDEVMSELDIDGSGTIEASEFMDKLKQFGQERTDEIAKCHEIFAEIDDDKSGFLDAKEVKKLAKRMGFEEQLSQKGFLKKMIAEMEAAGSDGAEGGAVGGRGRVRGDGARARGRRHRLRRRRGRKGTDSRGRKILYGT